MRGRDQQVGLAKQRNCTKCSKSGHNKATCKAIPAKVVAEGRITYPNSRSRAGSSRGIGAEAATRREIGADVSRRRGFEYTSEEVDYGYIDDSSSEEIDDAYIADSTSEEIDDANIVDSTSEESDDAYIDDSTSEDIDDAYIDDSTSEESSKQEHFEVHKWTVQRRRSTIIELDKARMKQTPTSASQLSHQSDVADQDQLIYWNKFIVVLPKHPHLQLEFPKKFVEKMKNKLSETVELIGPSGNTWNVELARTDGNLFLRNGWREFVADHKLKENNILSFEYKMESRFEISLFDESRCEIESIPFTRNSSDQKALINHMSKRKRKERGAGPFVRVSHPGNRQKDQHRELSVEGGPQLLVRAAKTQSISSIRAIVEAEMSEEDEQVYVEPKPKFPKSSVSGRDVSEGKRSSLKKRSLKKRVAAAYEGSKKPHFLVTMCETHVTRRFCLTIPKCFAREYLPRKNAVINLTMDDKTWGVNYKLYKQKTCVVVEGLGWADFVMKNSLKLGDVCAFEPSTQIQQRTAELKVTIFRIVEVVTPLMIWKRINGGRSGKKTT